MIYKERQFIVYVDNIIIDDPRPQIVYATNGPELLEKACKAMKIVWPPKALNFQYKIDIWSARMGTIGRLCLGELRQIPEGVTEVWLRVQTII